MEVGVKRRNIDFVVVDKHNPKYKFPIWNKLDFVRCRKDYDKIGYVDSDTMIHWDAPNPFEHIEMSIWCSRLRKFKMVK